MRKNVENQFIDIESVEKLDTEAEALVARIRERSCNLYETRQLLCTEAVVVALNEILDGGLTESKALAMTAPFCAALGETGCLCGALSGAVMASGLFLGDEKPYRHRRDIRNSARQLHDAFKAANGATCCKVLSKKVLHDKKARFKRCAELTAQATELAARLILKKRPELIERTKGGFHVQRQSSISGALSMLSRILSQ